MRRLSRYPTFLETELGRQRTRLVSLEAVARGRFDALSMYLCLKGNPPVAREGRYCCFPLMCCDFLWQSLIGRWELLFLFGYTTASSALCWSVY